jgi:pimeloyl-ACP methyl ester carboxylesterase
VDVPRETPDLAVQVFGAQIPGPPLLLLHAFPLDRSMWATVLPRLDGLAPVVAVDLPGFGASPLPEGEPSLDLAADGVAAVLDRLGRRAAVLAGVSMGGYVALAFARRHRDRVAGMALIDTKAETDPEPARENRERIAAAVLGEAGSRALAPMIDTLLGATSHADRPELVRGVAEAVAAAPVTGVAWAQRAMAARTDTREVLAGLDVPVAVVVGEEDPLSPPSTAAAMAATARDAVLSVLPRTGHLSPLESPGPVADALIGLLLRVSARR